MSSKLAILGICLTILGAFFLMLAIIVKSPRTVMREMLNVKVDRLKTFKYFLAQRIEAMLGFLFILLGASLQIYAQLAETPEAPRFGAYLVITILAMATLGFVLYRSCAILAKVLFVRSFRSFAERHRTPIHQDEGLLKELGDILEIPRDEHETIETFAEKIRKKLDLTYTPRR
jgi:uncharacterized membrane protein